MAVEMELHHIMVSGGDATAIIIKDNGQCVNKFLIDGGESGANFFGYLEKYFNFAYKNKEAAEARYYFDCLIVSHYHTDHIQGLVYGDTKVNFQYFMDVGGYTQFQENIYETKHGTGFKKQTRPISNHAKNVRRQQRREDTPAQRIPIPFIEKANPNHELIHLQLYPVLNGNPRVNQLPVGPNVIGLTCYCAGGILANGTDTIIETKKMDPNDLSLTFLLEWRQNDQVIFRYFTGGDISANKWRVEGIEKRDYVDRNHDPYSKFKDEIAFNKTRYYDQVTQLVNTYNENFTNIDVMKISHHGSKNNTNAYMLNAMQPRSLIVPAHSGKALPDGIFLYEASYYCFNDQNNRKPLLFVNGVSYKTGKNSLSKEYLNKIAALGNENVNNNEITNIYIKDEEIISKTHAAIIEIKENNNNFNMINEGDDYYVLISNQQRARIKIKVGDPIPCRRIQRGLNLNDELPKDSEEKNYKSIMINNSEHDFNKIIRTNKADKIIIPLQQIIFKGFELQAIELAIIILNVKNNVSEIWNYILEHYKTTFPFFTSTINEYLFQEHLPSQEKITIELYEKMYELYSSDNSWDDDDITLTNLLIRNKYQFIFFAELQPDNMANQFTKVAEETVNNEIKILLDCLKKVPNSYTGEKLLLDLGLCEDNSLNYFETTAFPKAIKGYVEKISNLLKNVKINEEDEDEERREKIEKLDKNEISFKVQLTKMETAIKNLIGCEINLAYNDTKIKNILIDHCGSKERNLGKQLCSKFSTLITDYLSQNKPTVDNKVYYITNNWWIKKHFSKFITENTCLTQIKIASSELEVMKWLEINRANTIFNTPSKSLQILNIDVARLLMHDGYNFMLKCISADEDSSYKPKVFILTKFENENWRLFYTKDKKIKLEDMKKNGFELDINKMKGLSNILNRNEIEIIDDLSAWDIKKIKDILANYVISLMQTDDSSD